MVKKKNAHIYTNINYMYIKLARGYSDIKIISKSKYIQN